MDVMLFVPWILPVITGLIGTWFGTKLEKSTEHRQWLRNQKIEVYTSLLRQIHASTTALDAHRQGIEAAIPQLDDIADLTNARLAIVAPSDIRHLAIWQHGATRNAYKAPDATSYDKERAKAEDLYGQLQTAIRRDLDLTEQDPWFQRARFWALRPVGLIKRR